MVRSRGGARAKENEDLREGKGRGREATRRLHGTLIPIGIYACGENRRAGAAGLGAGGWGWGWRGGKDCCVCWHGPVRQRRLPNTYGGIIVSRTG